MFGSEKNGEYKMKDENGNVIEVNGGRVETISGEPINDATRMTIEPIDIWLGANIAWIETESSDGMGYFQGLAQPILHLPRQVFSYVLQPSALTLGRLTIAYLQVIAILLLKTGRTAFSLFRIMRAGAKGRVRMIHLEPSMSQREIDRENGK